MAPSKQDLWHFIADETGVTLIEYAAAASLIAIVCIATLASLGVNLKALYTQVCTDVTSAISSSGAPGAC